MARFRAFASDSSEDEETSSQPEEEQSESSSEVSGSGSEESSEGEEESSSEASSEDERESSPSVRQNARKRTRNALIQNESGEYQYAHEVERVHSRSPSPPSRPQGDPSLIPWAQHVGIDAQRMHVMQVSMFRVPEEAAALKALKNEGTSRARPKLRIQSQQGSRKHSRDSDGDNLRFDSRERASFAHDIEPQPLRPSRKFARVEGSHSATNTHEGAVVDAGLSFGRSFRASWGPGGKLVYLGGLCGPNSSSKLTANSSTIFISTFPPVLPLALCPAPSTLSSATAAPENEDSPLPTILLQHHLSHTRITLDDAKFPFATPSPRDLDFASFSRLFPPSSTSPVASLFRLGRALFDPIKPKLPPRNAAPSITPSIRNHVETLLRTHSLSEFLTDALASTVDAFLRSPSFAVETSSAAQHTVPASALAAVFTLLTGNQVTRACEKATDAGYIKLATLVAQAGGDEFFQEDIRSQLEVWHQEGLSGAVTQGTFGQKTKAFVSDDVRRIYALLGGSFLDGEEETTLEVLSSLDWKRVFAVCLWYGHSGQIDKSVRDVFSAYENLFTRDTTGKVARPLPWYAESGTGKPSSPWKLDSSQPPHDAHYSLLRLHADPTLSLSHVLSPLSFSPSPADWSLCWHLYILLSRCMRVRDLGDRSEPVSTRSRSHGLTDTPDPEQDGIEGHSPSADLLTSTYAFQLEGAGKIQEAVFVLLHLEASVGREKAIKDLLGRSAAKLNAWATRGLHGSLQIPESWIDEAKAVYAFNAGDVFTAYELYLTAGLDNAAHDVAVSELAPDAILRQDFDLLKFLFEKFETRPVDGWHVRGKIFLDYAQIMNRLPDLLDEETDDALPDAAIATETEELIRKMYKVIGVLPDILHNKNDPRHKAALVSMTGKLVALIDKAKPLTLSKIQPSATDEKIKLAHIRSNAYARFMKSL
ncbi:hypothetical protein BDN72DRAFT_814625 [Pluteus cervinus]|uniref:Uncharacterized protein n=1 Tax=Pluteus cervinus TaxID=181527 RepID=A0ACD3B5W4_9AGAR|nr:hypothetical protein BDN72DRAFT_814625 [Pluteus cervinus]